MNSMELAEIISYWKRLSEEKWKTAEALMEKERYADALFFVHLSLDALLKAVVVEKTDEQAPRIHDLLRLAYLAGLEPDTEQQKQLAIFTTFNVEGRYDDYKLALHKKATKEYVYEYARTADILRLWIQKRPQ